MNIRPDMIRQPGPLPHLPQSMMGTQHFMPPGQPHPHPQQQPQQPHMALLQNTHPNPNPNPNPANNPAANMVPSGQGNTMQMQMQTASAQRHKQMLSQQAQHAQGLLPVGVGVGGGMNGLGTPNQFQGIPMNAIPTPNLRRVPQPMVGGPNVGGAGGMVGVGLPNMNLQPGLPAHLRAQHPHMRQPPQAQDMIALHRQSHLGIVRATSASGQQQQLMNNLAHPTNAFPTMSLPPQTQPSPRPGSHNHTHTPASVPSQSQSARPPRMTPDTPNPAFMSFPNPQNPNPNPTPPFAQPPARTNAFFAPASSSSPNPIPESIGVNAAAAGAPGFLTPAQQYNSMAQDTSPYPNPNQFMPPPSGPARPPSQQHQHQLQHQLQQHQLQHQQLPHPHPHQPLPMPQQQPQQPGLHHHHSPHQSDQMTMNGHHHQIPSPTRPQSQPLQPLQPVQQQQLPPRTPRAHQSHLPGAPANPNPNPGPMPPPARMQQPNQGQPPQNLTLPPSAQQQQQQHQPQPRTQIAPPPSNPVPRPPSVSANNGAGVGVALAAGGARPNNTPETPVGQGQCLQKMMQLSAKLANQDKAKMTLSFWENFCKEQFTPEATMKLTLWKDNQRNEAKPFEVGTPVLPRFFLVTHQSGVRSMQFTLDGARERLVSLGHGCVECSNAIWTFKYTNGYTITLRGPMTAHVIVYPGPPPSVAGTVLGAAQTRHHLRVKQIQFDASYHEKLLSLESILGQRVVESPKTPHPRSLVVTPNMNMSVNGNGMTVQQRVEEERKADEPPRVVIDHASIPGEPVNAFGIPQATMRCLELAESVAQMNDLIRFSTEQGLGPTDALKAFAKQLREQPAQTAPGFPPNTGGGGGEIGPSIGGANQMPKNPQFPPPNGTLPSSSTLYTSAPASVVSANTNTNANAQAGPSNLQQNPALPAPGSPSKQNKTSPQLAQNTGSAAASASSTTPAATSSSATTTPSMAHQPLKRTRGATSDAAGSSGPGTDQAPAPKRQATGGRKRRTTGGGGG